MSPPLRRPRALLTVCGLLSAGVGGAMILVSDRVEGLLWFAVPITSLGILLVGLGLLVRDRDVETPTPGRWYPFALLGIFAALCCWAIYWTKAR